MEARTRPAVRATTEPRKGHPEDCVYKVTHDVHAASNVTLDELILPTATTADPMGANSQSQACPVGNPLSETLKALLYKTADFSCVVHVMESRDPYLEDVEKCVAEVTPQKNVVVVLLPGSDSSHCTVRVLEDEHWESAELDENSTVSLIKTLQSAARTLVFYWSPRSAAYSAVLGQCVSSSWVCYVQGVHRYPDELLRAKVLCLDPRRLVKAAPLFYLPNGPVSMFVMGAGAGDCVSWDDLKVELEAQCRLITQRVHRSVASTGRCFCCQYSLNLARKLSQPQELEVLRPLKVLLAPKFHQDVARPR